MWHDSFVSAARANALEHLLAEWQPARLIPTFGVRGQREQERRAVSALLAVVRAVPEFGHALLSPTPAPRGRIATFAEVCVRDSDGATCIPDGAIVVERGRSRWVAFVEVKTGSATLDRQQLTRYLDVGRSCGIDALLTISNEITGSSDELPIQLDKRKLRRVQAYHLSWWRVITEAVLQHRYRGISDPDQAWILSEFLAYLDHPNSGATGFLDMGRNWPRVRDGARQGALRRGEVDVREVAETWDRFVDYVALALAQELGRDVTPVRPAPREARIDAAVDSLASAGVLEAALCVPDAVAPLAVRADLRARQVTTRVTLDAPREGRVVARLNWLLRQLESAPDELRIEAAFAALRETSTATLAQARTQREQLLSRQDPRREPRLFRLELTRPLGHKGGTGAGSFVRETRQQIFDFYRSVVQDLRRWRPRPPRIAEADEAARASRPPAPVAPVAPVTPPPTSDTAAVTAPTQHVQVIREGGIECGAS